MKRKRRTFLELKHLRLRFRLVKNYLYRVDEPVGSTYIEIETLGSWYGTIAESRRQANQIKRDEPITVVIGNPPYKKKAKGRGGWIEERDTA